MAMERTEGMVLICDDGEPVIGISKPRFILTIIKHSITKKIILWLWRLAYFFNNGSLLPEFYGAIIEGNVAITLL